MVEQATLNRKVKGSNPFTSTMEVLNKFVLPVNKKTNVWFKETLILTIWGDSLIGKTRKLARNVGSNPTRSTQTDKIRKSSFPLGVLDIGRPLSFYKKRLDKVKILRRRTP